MAYFSNSTEGSVFDEQCSRCKYGDDACPIALAQMTGNYKQFEHPTLKLVLEMLVKNDGTCEMFALAKKDLAIQPPDGQTSLFDEVFGEEKK